MSNKELQALKERYVAAGAASPNDQFADHALNAEVWDADGKRMIDFAGGIGVLNIGHRHPRVVEAVKAQLDKLMHTCQTVMPYEGYVKLPSPASLPGVTNAAIAHLSAPQGVNPPAGDGGHALGMTLSR